MRWFIKRVINTAINTVTIRALTLCKQGNPVVESAPSTIPFWHHYPVSGGFPKSHSLSVYCDRLSLTAPFQPTKKVVELVRLEASLTGIKGKWPKKKGADGKKYYLLEGSIEAAYGSASTEYTLIYRGW